MSLHSKSHEHPQSDNSQPDDPPVVHGPPAQVVQAASTPREDTADVIIYNQVSYARSVFMEYAGEFFGIMILVLFGTGANCQVNLSANTNVSATPAGDWTSLSLGWGTGIALGVWLTGGHINPAITLAFAVWRGFPWRKVPGYIVAQLLGGLVGGGIVYGNYIAAIDIVEGGRGIRTSKTARFFGFIPLDYLSNVSCFFSEFICTALLLVGVLALTDKRNQLSPGLVPVGLFIVFVGIVASFGMQTGFAVNPASDLGPRIFSSMVGYGTQVYTFRHQYWLWGPVMATITGAQVGTMLYDVFLFSGDESIVNYLRVRRDFFPKMRRRKSAHLASGPAGMV